jgi:2-polyprenyl-3-methyl-5-hydroxy-6-metoxy-1,4-benzoquinol methylase
MAQASIQTVQQYWDARPCNIRHSDKPVGSREYFDEVEKRKYFVEPHIPGFAEFARWSGKRVLEVGCGIGTDTISFARAGAHVTAVDLSGKSLALAASRARSYGLDGRIRFFQADAEDLSAAVPREEYDLVYSFGVIHHTPHPSKAIESIRQHMSAHSEIRLMIYAANSWKAAMIDAGFDQPEAQTGCPVAHTYTEGDARELLAGFEILAMHQDHIFPYVIEKYVRYEYELQPWFKCMPVEMFRALERRFGWHMLIRARLT